MKVTVIGAGITGLAAALEARRLGAEVTVLEASSRVGGLIRTTPLEISAGDGARSALALDEAADAFLARQPEAVELCHELGLAERLTQPAATRAMVWTDGGLRWFPAGSVLGIPLDLEDLRATGLLTDDGVARVAAELERRGPGPDGDVAIGAFLRERFGDELVDRVVGPLVGGIAAGDVEEMSLRAVMPQVADAAAAGDSLMAELRRRAAAAAGDDRPVFHGLLGGTGVLVDALVARLADEGVELRTDSPVEELPTEGAVVLSTPAAVSARLLTPISAEATRELAAIRTTSATMVAMVWDRADVPGANEGELTASGFLVPRQAGMFLSAVSWASVKWSHWDDGRHVVLRASTGHVHDHRARTMDDAGVVDALCADLRTTMGIEAAPLVSRVSRWNDGFHQYDVGHLERVERIDDALRRDTDARVAVAGAAYRGLGIPACIRQGYTAAAAVCTGA